MQSAQTQGNSTRLYLEHSRYDVIWAGSGISALMAARNQRVDLILLDFALPDIEGGDLCRRFRARDDTRDIPVILLTARGSAPESFSRPPDGPDDYLAKPYTESELDGRINTVLRVRKSRLEEQPAAAEQEIRPVEPMQALEAATRKGSAADPARSNVPGRDAGATTVPPDERTAAPKTSSVPGAPRPQPTPQQREPRAPARAGAEQGTAQVRQPVPAPSTEKPAAVRTERKQDGSPAVPPSSGRPALTPHLPRQAALQTAAKQEPAQVRETAPSPPVRLGQPSPPAILPQQAVPGGPPATPQAQQQPLPPPAADDSEVIDAATGLFSKRQFEAMFSKEFKRSVRFKQQMSCMMIDLDGRTLGRTADAALVKAIIGLVQTTIREVDTAAVWTGDSFIVLLPNTIRNDAVQAGMRVLEAVAVHPFSWSDSTRVTMSIGVAGLPDHAIDTEQKMIDAARKACARARDWAGREHRSS